jgi:calcineurin-like phosphoesterase family protein
MYFASELFFGDSEVAARRHFTTPEEMSAEIISKWNKTVCPEDTVFILGGIGDMSFIKSLNGRKVLLMSKLEEEHMRAYITSISRVRDRDVDQDMYSYHMRSEFGINYIVYSGKSIQKIYSGRTVHLSSKYMEGFSNMITICGLMGEYHRVHKTGINANIFLNGMYPISEVDVEDMLKHLNDKW